MARRVRRLPRRGLLVPLALLVVALTSLMHTSAAHACGTSMTTSQGGSPVRAGADHAGHDTAHDTAHDTPHDGRAAAPDATAAAAEDHPGGALCSSALPPQQPVLGTAAVVATAPDDAPVLAASLSAAASPSDRGPPGDLLTVLCVRRT